MNRVVKTAALAIGIAASLGVFFSIQTPAQQQQKFAFIRPDYILAQYDPYIEAIKKVEALEKSETDKLKRMADSFQKKVEDAQKQAPLMKEEQILQKRQELEREQAKLQQAQEDLFDRQDGTLVKEHTKLVQPIFESFNRVLERIGKAENYDFIFNADLDNQVILYADPRHDISERILAELKKEPAASLGSSSAVPPAKR